MASTYNCIFVQKYMKLNTRLLHIQHNNDIFVKNVFIFALHKTKPLKLITLL